MEDRRYKDAKKPRNRVDKYKSLRKKKRKVFRGVRKGSTEQSSDVFAVQQQGDEAPTTTTQNVSASIDQVTPTTTTQNVSASIDQVTPTTTTQNVSASIDQVTPTTTTQNVSASIDQVTPTTTTQNVSASIDQVTPTTTTQNVSASIDQVTPTTTTQNVSASIDQVTPTTTTQNVSASIDQVTPTTTTQNVSASIDQVTPTTTTQNVSASIDQVTPTTTTQNVSASIDQVTPTTTTQNVSASIDQVTPTTTTQNVSASIDQVTPTTTTQNVSASIDQVTPTTTTQNVSASIDQVTPTTTTQNVSASIDQVTPTTTTNFASIDEATPTTSSSAMERKLSLPIQISPAKREAYEKGIFPSDGYKIIDSSVLQDLLNSTSICSSCEAKQTLVVNQNNMKRRGMCETLVIHCTSCNKDTKTFDTSKKIGNTKMIDINLRSVMAATSMGGGITILRRLCTDFNFPQPVAEHPYNNYMKHVVNVSVENADKSTKDAAKRLRQLVIEGDDDGHSILDVSVSVDGSWQKRHGFNSLLGMVFVISVETGQVLDYSVKCLFCHECKKTKKCHTGMEGQPCTDLPNQSRWKFRCNGERRIN